MEIIQKTFLASVVTICGLFIFNLNVKTQPKPWIVPSEYKAMTNPVAKVEESNKTGQVLYTKYCASCHGKTGLGDGVKARVLNDFPGNFSDASYQGQTDGEQFYKTKFGRGEMPKYEGRCTDEEIWKMVNYMRTFKK